MITYSPPRHRGTEPFSCAGKTLCLGGGKIYKIVFFCYYLELIDILRCRSFRDRATRVGAPLPERPGPSIGVDTPLSERRMPSKGVDTPLSELPGASTEVLTPPSELPGASTEVITPLSELPGASKSPFTPLPRRRRCPPEGERERRAASACRGFRGRPPLYYPQPLSRLK